MLARTYLLPILALFVTVVSAMPTPGSVVKANEGAQDACTKGFKKWCNVPKARRDAASVEQDFEAVGELLMEAGEAFERRDVEQDFEAVAELLMEAGEAFERRDVEQDAEAVAELLMEAGEAFERR